MAKLTCELTGKEVLERLKLDDSKTTRVVEAAAQQLAVLVRSKAPSLSGDLRSGIIPSPWVEMTATPGKIVCQVYFDDGMNDTFVKYSKSGKRYYYPASQEYGFKLNRAPAFMAGNQNVKKVGNHLEWKRSVLVAHGYVRRIPGKYFMRDSAVEYAPTFEKMVLELLDEVAKNG